MRARTSLFAKPIKVKQKIKRPDSLLFSLATLMQELKKNYKSVEDYFPLHLEPELANQDIASLLAEGSVKKIQAFLILHALPQLASHLASQQFHKVFSRDSLSHFSVSLALLLMSGHGNSLALTHTLILKILEKNMVKNIFHHHIRDQEGRAIHFILEIKQENQPCLILDPYLNISLSAKEYWQEEKPLTLIRQLMQNPSWSYETNKDDIYTTSYLLATYSRSTTKWREQAKTLNDLLNSSANCANTDRLQNLFDYVASLSNTALDREQAGNYLSLALAQDQPSPQLRRC